MAINQMVEGANRTSINFMLKGEQTFWMLMMPNMLCHRIVSALLVAFIFHAISGVAFQVGAEEFVKGRPVLPGENCKTAHQNNWTEQERWVWKEVCEGREADLIQREGYRLEPNNTDRWHQERILRPAFLESILLHEPYVGALTHRGVRIKGAWFTEAIDLSNSTLTKPVALDGCRFDKKVNLQGLETRYWISFVGSSFNGNLYMNHLQVVGSLYLDQGGRFHGVDLSGAIIGDVLAMRGSTFIDTLDMNKLQVGTNLLMNEGASFQSVKLSGTIVGGEFDMKGSNFDGTLLMTGLLVHGSLFMEEASFASVDLRGARIDGQVIMVGSKFSDTLDMGGLQVGDALVLQQAQVSKAREIDLTFAKIDSNLDISGSTLPSLNLTGTQIKGEFRLGSNQHPPVKWRDGAKLTLRNTEVGTLQDRLDRDAWPKELELDGFTYSHLGGMAGDGASDLTGRDVGWFKEWLTKQQLYSPQPYEQLAGLFRKAGQTQKAVAILYESKERERTEKASGLDWLWLTLLKIFIGYGYQTISRITLWVIIFTGIGTIMLRVSRHNPFNSVFENTPAVIPHQLYNYFSCNVTRTVEIYLPLIAYSFDRFLPIIRLRYYHYSKIDLRGGVAYYFYFHQFMGFFLASLLIASLTGLTAK